MGPLTVIIFQSKHGLQTGSSQLKDKSFWCLAPIMKRKSQNFANLVEQISIAFLPIDGCI